MRSEIIESVLNKHKNIVWEYRDVSLNSIDRSRSHKNQARIAEPINNAIVKQYASAMQNGDSFPALVVFPDNANRYVVADGNHRVEASLASGKTHHDAYVVISDDPSTRLMLTFEMNSVLTGLRPDDSDRDHQAVFLVRQGLDRDAVALHMHMSPSRVDDLLKERNAEERAIRLGVQKEWKKIVARNSRLHIARLTLDAPFCEATRLISNHSLTIRDAQKIVTALLSLGSETEQLDHIASIEAGIIADQQAAEQAERERKEAKRAKIRTTRAMDNPAVRFKAHLKFMVNVDRHFDSEVLAGMDESERKEVADMIQLAQAGLQKALEMTQA